MTEPVTAADRQWQQKQWQELHRSFEQSERYSLLIKLFAMACFVFALTRPQLIVFSSLLIAVLWLQDAIWKTFQARTEAHLLKLEQALAESQKLDAVELGFYRHFDSRQGGIVDLVGEYLKQMQRPTIAYPYVVLILLNIVLAFK